MAAAAVCMNDQQMKATVDAFEAISRRVDNELNSGATVNYTISFKLSVYNNASSPKDLQAQIFSCMRL